jgi:ABC-type dipeptide/oligopeptide/nickel transport system permease subunit
VLVEAWWISVFAGIFIVLTVMSFNLIGEAIQNSMRTNSA